MLMVLEKNKFYNIYSGHSKNATLSRIQMTELRGFVPKFLPLYHLVAAVNSPTQYAATGGIGEWEQRRGR